MAADHGTTCPAVSRAASIGVPPWVPRGGDLARGQGHDSAALRLSASAVGERILARPALALALVHNGHPTHLLGQECGHCGDGIHHLPPVCTYPRGQVPGPKGLDQHCGHTLTPNHRHQRAGGPATRKETQVDLTWMMHRPIARLTLEKFRDHYQLAPTNLQEWL